MSAGPAPDRAQLVQSLIARQSWSRDELLGHQRLALRELVDYAVAKSRYYRDIIGDAGRGDGSLGELPTLSKETLMAEWDRVVTDPRLRLEHIERHLAGDAPDSLYLDEYRVLATGGSTGARGIFVYGPEEFETSVATNLRAVLVAGLRPDMRVVPIGSPSPLHLTSHVFAAMRAGKADSPRLAVTAPLEELVERLNEYRPDAIATYPSILRQLAEEQLGGRLRIAPQIAATGSEVLTDDTRELAREAWGISVRNVYASTEGAMLASETPAQVGLHVWEDCSILEVVDERNRPVPPGVPGDKVLVTVLWSRTQPLIRYELADSVTLAEEPDPSGRPFPRIERVDGRSADILRLPARGGGQIAVHPIHLRTPFTRLPEVRQYQFRLGDDELRVQLVLAEGAPRDVLESVRAALVRALEGTGAVPPPIHVEPVEAIARVGSGAKLTLVEPGAQAREPVLAT